MAKRQRPTDGTRDDFVENIVDIDVSTEMEGSFLEYAYSVIYSRALPDARDGLKPVQRRILYMMSEMGLRPEKGHVKSARVVGEVMGKLHPHGDSAIYDTMVRMAQDWTLRLPLIDGHGNFGSLDDGPAAPRYTEARLAAAALELTGNLDENVVDFVPNYDNQMMQPSVLPAAYPNLLVNGASGIAVGMATNMAPHNLGEVIAAAQHLIANPHATLEDVMAYVPGPDLPSGGRIVGLQGIRDAYAGGRGSFKTRAKIAVEQLTPRRVGLVVTELPYLVGPEKVREKLKDALTNNKIVGIADFIDLSDRKNGLRLVIEIKNGFNPAAVMEQLYRYTPLEESFGINNVCLVDGQPQTLGLLPLLQVFVAHRIDVVRRRTAFRLGKKQDRLHLVEGMLIAIVDIDEVIQIIRTSDEVAAARERLMAIYDLSEIQANYILDLQLRQLTRFSMVKLEAERDELRREIAALEAILGSEELLHQLVSDELGEVAAQVRHPAPHSAAGIRGLGPLGGQGPGRRARRQGRPAGPGNRRRPLLGAAQRHGPDRPDQHGRSAGGIRRAEQARRLLLRAENQRPVRDWRTDLAGPHAAPAGGGHARAAAHRRAAQSGRRRGGQGLHHPDQGRDAGGLCAAECSLCRGHGHRRGQAGHPRVPLNRDDWEYIALKPKDFVVGAGVATDDDDLVFITQGAQLLRYSAANVRPQGRTAGGMAGIKLGAGR